MSTATTMSTVNTSYLIALTDSRGRGLRAYINKNCQNYVAIIRLLPGRSLQQIATIASTLLPKYKQSNFYCIIHAGICSLTIKTAVGHPNSLRYPLFDREERVREVIETITNLKASYTNRINICTIAPASLHKYFHTKHPATPIPRGLDEEQEALIEDLFIINRVIKELNADWLNPNINLSARFFAHSKKRQRKSKTKTYKRVTKLKDNDLVDGLHFSNKIRATCFKLITRTAASELVKLYRPPSPSTSESSSTDSSTDA